jgi:hypothetical protein
MRAFRTIIAPAALLYAAFWVAVLAIVAFGD